MEEEYRQFFQGLLENFQLPFWRLVVFLSMIGQVDEVDCQNLAFHMSQGLENKFQRKMSEMMEQAEEQKRKGKK